MQAHEPLRMHALIFSVQRQKALQGNYCKDQTENANKNTNKKEIGFYHYFVWSVSCICNATQNSLVYVKQLSNSIKKTRFVFLYAFK